MEIKSKIPSWVIKMIHKNLSVKILQKQLWDLPSENGQVERLWNENFNLSIRNLPQGLSISPMLSIENTKRLAWQYKNRI